MGMQYTIEIRRHRKVQGISFLESGWLDITEKLMKGEAEHTHELHEAEALAEEYKKSHPLNAVRIMCADVHEVKEL